MEAAQRLLASKAATLEAQDIQMAALRRQLALMEALRAEKGEQCAHSACVCPESACGNQAMGCVFRVMHLQLLMSHGGFRN